MEHYYLSIYTQVRKEADSSFNILISLIRYEACNLSLCTQVLSQQ
jgi:hypothetical protein